MGPPDTRRAARSVPPDGGRGLRSPLILAFALAGFVAAAGVMADNSLLTHLATGRLILDSGVPAVDPYSRFGVGQDWTVQSWLVSVVYALLDRLAGPPAIRLFNGFVGATIGAGIWQLTRPARDLPTRVLLAALPLAIGVGLWSPRPLLVGLAALVALLVVLQDDRPGWLLVPLLWLWANAHGSFPLGVGILVLVAIGRWIEGRRRPERELRLVGWAVLGTVLGAIGPIGARLLWFPVEVVASRQAMIGVVEWEPPSYSSPAELAWLAVAILPLVAARRRLGLAHLLPAAAMVVAATLALRNVAPASIVVVAMVAPALAKRPTRAPRPGDGARSGSVGVAATDQNGPDGGARRRQPALARAVGVASAAALVMAILTVVTTDGLELDRYPVAEVDALERRGLMPSSEVVTVHREAVGNYLTWRYGVESRVFVDDRFDFHDEQLLADHRDLLEARNPRAVLDRWDADVVLWEIDHALVAWLDEAPEWSVSRGGEWVVACRVDGRAGSDCPTALELGDEPSVAQSR